MSKHGKDSRHVSRASIIIKLLAALLTVIVILVSAVIAFAVRRDRDTPVVGGGTVETRMPTEAPSTAAPTQVPTEPPTEAPTEPPVAPEVRQAQTLLDTLTLEQKVYQMIMTTPDALTGQTPVTVAGETTRAALERFPVGGLVYFARNVEGEAQIREMIANSQAYSALGLLIGVDEEGGRVSRLSGIGVTTAYEPMAAYGAAEDAATVREIGATLGSQLGAVGFNLDFAPVADVVTNPNNTEIGDRSFSSDPSVTAEMVEAMIQGLHESGTISCLKHFPGHGSTETDSHLGRSVTLRTLDELRQTELLPFCAGIEAGADMVMISHMSAPSITGDNTPCDLSGRIVTDLLREELGFTGVVITDSHEMGAITEYYEVGEAAVLAVEAGCDIILMPPDPERAARAIMDAVESGALTEERIDESVLRILTVKYRYGILA